MINDNKTKSIWIIISFIIFCLCVYYMITFFQWRNIYLVLKSANLAWLLGALSVTIIAYWFLRTLRWYIMLKAIGTRIDIFHLYMVTSVSLALSLITPFQSGEALKIEILKKTGMIDRIPGYSVFIAERLMDLIAIIVLAMVSIFFGMSNILEARPLLITTGAILSFSLITMILIRHIPLADQIVRFFKPFSQFMHNRRVLMEAILLTFAGWIMIALSWHICLLCISITIPFEQSIALVSIITLINLISFIPGAVGVSEVSIAAFLMYLHLSAPVAQAGAFVIRIYGLLVLLLGAIHYLWSVSLHINPSIKKRERL